MLCAMLGLCCRPAGRCCRLGSSLAHCLGGSEGTEYVPSASHMQIGALLRFGRQSGASEEPRPNWHEKHCYPWTCLHKLKEASHASSSKVIKPALCAAETRPATQTPSSWLAVFVSSIPTTYVAHVFEAIKNVYFLSGIHKPCSFPKLHSSLDSLCPLWRYREG